MSSRRVQPTFAAAAAVSNVYATPSSVVTVRPGLQADSSFVDRAGRSYELIDDRLTAADVTDRAASGAVVVWDSCGCGGFCELTWLGADAVARLTSSAPPKVPRKYRYLCEFSEWRAEDGTALLLVQGPVVWGFDVAANA